jgi:hypothetical protein
VERLQKDLSQFSLSWDDFCSIDHNNCTPPQAKTDLLYNLETVVQ